MCRRSSRSHFLSADRALRLPQRSVLGRPPPSLPRSHQPGGLFLPTSSALSAPSAWQRPVVWNTTSMPQMARSVPVAQTSPGLQSGTCTRLLQPRLKPFTNITDEHPQPQETCIYAALPYLRINHGSATATPPLSLKPEQSLVLPSPPKQPHQSTLPTPLWAGRPRLPRPSAKLLQLSLRSFHTTHTLVF